MLIRLEIQEFVVECAGVGLCLEHVFGSVGEVGVISTKELTENMDHIRRLLQAFSFRDLQVANTLYVWLSHNQVSVDEFTVYMIIAMEINRLEAQGFFLPTATTPEQAREIKRLETTVENKRIRQYVRHLRMLRTRFSSPGQRGGG